MRVRTHPGEVLRCEYLEPLELSATALAEAMDVPANRITDIVRGRRDVSADTALRLAKFFDTTPDFWMNLQTAHDLSKAKAREVPALELIADRAKKILPQSKSGIVTRSSGSGRFYSVAAAAPKTTKSVFEKTSQKVAATASRVLRDPKASKAEKSVAASALTQKVKGYHSSRRSSERGNWKSKK